MVSLLHAARAAAISIVCWSVTCAAEGARVATLDDAFRVQALGEVAAHPHEPWVAIESAGGILVRRISGAPERLAQLDGSRPAWSPDGRHLAFYRFVDGFRQIFLWDAKTGRTRQLSRLREGISPNPYYVELDAQRLTWAPNSRAIAFTTRIIDFSTTTLEASSPVRILKQDAPYMAVLHGLFRTDFWEAHEAATSDLSGPRMRAIEAQPARGLNRLFLVNIDSGHLRSLTTRGQHFSPAWSPDARTIAVVADDSGGVHYPGPLKTSLALIDVDSGAERRIAPPMERIGELAWSPDGEYLSLISQRSLISFHHLMLYSLRSGTFAPLALPGGLSTIKAKWAREENTLLVQAADRFLDSFWHLAPGGSGTRRVYDRTLSVTEWDQDTHGNLIAVVSGPTFASKLVLLAADDARPPQELHDPNPWLAQLTLAEQRRVTWRNAFGEEVDGILILPPGFDAHRRYPLIVDVYPRPARDRFELRATPRLMGQLEAARGFVVFQPGLRSPHTPGTFSRDEIYTERARGAQGLRILLEDFRSGIEHLRSLGFVDTSRLCIYGASNGGFAANLVITNIEGISCAVVHSGASNLTHEQFIFPPGGWVDEITNGTVFDNLEEYVALSPLFRMNKVDADVLLVVGDNDWLPWVPEMVAQFNALRQAGKRVTFLRYSGEGHAFRQRANVEDSLRRIHEFMESHLMPERAR